MCDLISLINSACGQQGQNVQVQMQMPDGSNLNINMNPSQLLQRQPQNSSTENTSHQNEGNAAQNNIEDDNSLNFDHLGRKSSGRSKKSNRGNPSGEGNQGAPADQPDEGEVDALEDSGQKESPESKTNNSAPQKRVSKLNANAQLASDFFSNYKLPKIEEKKESLVSNELSQRESGSSQAACPKNKLDSLFGHK